LVLPASALAMYSMAIIARMTRSSMLETLQQDYIRTARAKGIPESRVISKHPAQRFNPDCHGNRFTARQPSRRCRINGNGFFLAWHRRLYRSLYS
jgi:hypothetical protein